MESDFRAILVADGDITVAVGTRIHWSLAPENTSRPFMVLHKVSGATEHSMAGVSDLTSARVQVDIVADDFASADAVNVQVLNVLNGYCGESGATYFESILLQNELRRADKSDAQETHLISLDFSVWSKPTV